MQLGLIGPAQGAAQQLQRAIEFLMADAAMRQVIYLGDDGAADAVVEQWAARHVNDEQFLLRGAELACKGSTAEIDELLGEQTAAARLWAVRKLPEPPARAIEMLDKWMVLAVHDKAVLDEDDISNAHIIVYGKSDQADIKRFGPRAFFTPGPVHKGSVGVLDLQPEGKLELRILSLSGEVLRSETATTTTAKLVVSG